MLGTMFTPDRDRAKLVGFVVHLVNGWLFACVYAAAFESWRRATWWLGALIGLVHALFVLLAGMPLLPGAAPAHGQRAARPDADAAARAARLPGAQLRPPDAALGAPGPPRLRRDPGRVLPTLLRQRANLLRRASWSQNGRQTPTIVERRLNLRRAALVAATRQALANGLALLGIAAPAAM